MQRQIPVLLTVLALPLTFGSCAHAKPLPGTPAAFQSDDDHDQAREAREQGHQDGMQAAAEDMRDGRPPDADHHERFRHPPVKDHLRDAYRDGFRDGYNDAYRHGEHHDHDADRPQ